MIKVAAAADTSKLRVSKKLSPQSRGAIKLAARFGEALICVRHRLDAKGAIRYTTVELLVEATPIRRKIDPIVSVRIPWDDQSMQVRARAAGATWDSRARVWHMPRRIARKLGLMDLIID